MKNFIYIFYKESVCENFREKLRINYFDGSVLVLRVKMWKMEKVNWF